MISITEAIEMAEARKQAVIGDTPGYLRHSGSEANDRAIFSGLDVDYAELAHVAGNIGPSLAAQAVYMPCGALIAGAWVDGLLIGLLMGIDRGRSS